MDTPLNPDCPRRTITISPAMMDEVSSPGSRAWAVQQQRTGLGARAVCPRSRSGKGNGMLTRKAFKYRLYPTRTQEQTLLFVLRRCRHLYNSGLEERRAFYQMRRKSLGYSAQAAELAETQSGLPRLSGHLQPGVTRCPAPPGQSLCRLLPSYQERRDARLSAVSGTGPLRLVHLSAIGWLCPGPGKPVCSPFPRSAT